MSKNKTAKGFIVSGSVLLAITSFLHLYLGLPPIIAAIDGGQISEAPLMAPSELLGIWVTFSVLIFFIIIGILFHIRKNKIDRTFIAILGMAPVGAAITMLISNPGVHISVPLLSVPGLLIIIGAVILKPTETTSTDTKSINA